MYFACHKFFHQSNISFYCFYFTELGLWEQATLESATQTVHSFELSFFGKQVSDNVIKNKWELMGLDKHLQVSVMSNILNPSIGASNYASDRSDINRTLLCRTKSREERLDLKALVSQKIPSIPADRKEEATHVVVGVYYGAELYCVLCNDLDENENCREEEAEENFSNLLTKWKTSLTQNQDVFEFKDKFDREEKQRLSHLKCRVYADLHREAVRECSVYEAYKQNLILVDQVQNSSRENNNNTIAVPITVVLCPIEALSNPTKKLHKPIKFYDVDVDLVARCHRTWEKLDRIRTKADAVRAGVRRDNRSRLRRFVDAIVKYQEILKKNLKKSVVESRQKSDDDGVVKFVDIVENHRLFSPSKLKRWLFYETSEVEMMEELVTGDDICLAPEFFDPKPTCGKKFILLLFVPSLNDMARDVISEMEDYVEDLLVLLPSSPHEADDYSQDGDKSEDEEEKDGIAFKTAEHKRKLLQSNIRQLAEHIERNKGFDSNPVQYFVATDRDQETKFCHLLYDFSQSEENPEKTYWFELPKRPTNVRIQPKLTDKIKRAKTTSTSVRIEWDYKQNEDFPCYFLVDYRLKGNVQWTRKKTNETHLVIDIDSAAEFRVAAGCCVGLGPYTDVIDSNAMEEDSRRAETPTFHKQPQITEGPSVSTSTVVLSTRDVQCSLQPPTGLKVGLVTQTTAEIEWTVANVQSQRFTYYVRYRMDGQQQQPDTTSLQTLFVGWDRNSCRLEKLVPDTKYFVAIGVFSPGQKKMSSPSEAKAFKTETKEVRFAQILKKLCQKIEMQNGIEVHYLPLAKSVSSSPVQRHVFGRPGNKEAAGHKTILLLGASGSGKTSLINGIVNYIFGVHWQDPFRFRLDQTDTGRFNVYDIHHYEGFNVGCSLTIIDTPGYGEDAEKNREIFEMLRAFFEDNNGEQKVNLVAFVMKSTLPKPTAAETFIYESIVSIFGKDIEENVTCVLTFADKKEDPPLLSNLTGSGLPSTFRFAHFKLDSSVFFCRNRKLSSTDVICTMDRLLDLNVDYNYNSFLWSVAAKSFYSLFNAMDRMDTKSLSMASKLLDDKKRLESTVEGLESLINTGLMKMEELRTVKEKIASRKTDVGFQVQMVVPQKLEMPFGHYLTNCTKCNITCHKSCGSDDVKSDCDVMDRSKAISVRTCRVCPGNCMWNVHANQFFRWEFAQKLETTSLAAIHRKYEDKLKKKLTVGEIISELEKETDAKERAVLDQFVAVANYKEQLDRSKSRSALQLINIWINKEKKEKSPNHLKKIKSLKRIRFLCVVRSLVSS